MNNSYNFVCIEYGEKSQESDFYTENLHKEELAVITRAVEKRKLEFLYGRICAKTAYKRLSGADSMNNGICINKDRAGAPYFEDGRYFLSISHDAGIAAAIVTVKEKLKIGLDIQKISSKHTDTIYEFINSREKAKADTISGKYGLDATMAAFWVAKEAMSKLFGYGFAVYDALEIEDIEGKDILSVVFANLKSFRVALRKYNDYIFGFAAYYKDIDLFSEKTFTINPEGTDRII